MAGFVVFRMDSHAGACGCPGPGLQHDCRAENSLKGFTLVPRHASCRPSQHACHAGRYGLWLWAPPGLLLHCSPVAALPAPAQALTLRVQQLEFALAMLPTG